MWHLQNPFRQVWEKDYGNMCVRWCRISAGGLVALFFVICVVMTAYTAMWVKLLVLPTAETWSVLTVPMYNETRVGGDIVLVERPDRQWNTNIAGSVISAVSIAIFGQVYTPAALKLTGWENHKTETTYSDFLILKTFAFQFLNNYFALFFISFLKYGYIFGVESTCKYDDCMAELEIQLLILAMKDFFMNIVQTGMPFVKQRCGLGNVMHRTALYMYSSIPRLPPTCSGAIMTDR
eukprot:SAG22_NODE_499_length_9725_cov_2.325784_8_plen_236_part_00